LGFIDVHRNQGEYIVKKTIQLGAAALVLMMTATAGAQDKPAPAAQDKPSPVAISRGIPVKIQLVLSRFQGEKKLSSAPYMLWLTTNDSRTNTSLRMGVKIPVYSGTPGSFSYHDVGTNIDCSVSPGSTPGDGMYKVNLTVTDSSVYFPNRDRPNTGVPPPTSDTAPPAFRSFSSNFGILLRDGQTGQFTSATDQASGEVLKIDATLNVLK
jgi:hypothetical protein